MPRLRRVDCATPAISRRRRGRGFEYLDESGERIEDPDVLERIRELAIPPAWEEVWICADPLGHIQATGVDARGRKQYRYHDLWRERRDRQKFDAMVDFARSLPKLRAQVERDLRRRAISRERVLACAVRLLDRGFFRIGSEDYAEENETYGLATMRKRHVSVNGDTRRLRLRGEGRKAAGPDDRRSNGLATGQDSARAAAEGATSCSPTATERSGATSAPPRSTTTSRTTIGEDHSAKDFRTWNATVLAAVVLAASRTGARSAHQGRGATARSGTRSIRSRTTWATRRRSAGPPTSTRGSSTASTAGSPSGGCSSGSRTIPPTGPRFRGRSRRPCSTSSIGVNRPPPSSG